MYVKKSLHKRMAAILLFTILTLAVSQKVRYVKAYAGIPYDNPQELTPDAMDDGGMLAVTPVGQKFAVSQTNRAADITKLNSVGYFLFPESTEAYKMEADIRIVSVGSASNAGVFPGLFSADLPVSRIMTVGFRGTSGATGGIRNLYTKSGGAVGAGGLNTTYTVGEVIHVVVFKTAQGVTTEVTVNSKVSSYTVAYGNMEFLTGITDPACYGFAFANVEAEIRNLTVVSEDGMRMKYDQNDCYDAVGTAPAVNSLNLPVLSPDRTKIAIGWSGDVCQGDGAFMVELSRDGGAAYEVLDRNVTRYEYIAAVNGDGAYQFRITGVCGSLLSNQLESQTVYVEAPLMAPTIKADSKEHSIFLSWNPVDEAHTYIIFRRSSEEIEFTKLMETKGLFYNDIDVINEIPYSYYIIAKSDRNESNGSNIAMSVPTIGHSGTYVYENEAANITITKKSYDTLFSGKATLEGAVDRSGSMVLYVNDEKKQSVYLGTNGFFRFRDMNLLEGRNDVVLLFTDSSGRVTRKTFNFVYLTHYDKIVDSSYTGIDGGRASELPDIPVYKTVQAAVDSVPANNTDPIVILLKEGNYVEHLVISSPNISLIGEDMDKVRISFFDPVQSPPGGDMTKRCAVYVTSLAENFSAENLTFENTYQYLGDGSVSNESADALRVDADKSMFLHVKMIGYQDTLNASTNRQFYKNCYITGNVDFIYGSAQALFEDCEIVFRYQPVKNSGYITAPRTDPDKYGYIFHNCRILAERGCSGSKYLLARPWGANGFAAFIECYMSKIIHGDAPYADMSGNLATEARFLEYYSYGGGFAINTLRPQLSKTQAYQLLETTNLLWDPFGNSEMVSLQYVGHVITEGEDKFTEQEYENSGNQEGGSNLSSGIEHPVNESKGSMVNAIPISPADWEKGYFMPYLYQRQIGEPCPVNKRLLQDQLQKRNDGKNIAKNESKRKEL